MVKLEIQKPPGSPHRDAWDARMEGGTGNGGGIHRLHEGQCGGKACPKCPPGQRIRRDCTSAIPGRDGLSCDHMRRAFARRHGRPIHQQGRTPGQWACALTQGSRRAGRGGAQTACAVLPGSKLPRGRKIFDRDLYGLWIDDPSMGTLEARDAPKSPAQDAWDERMKDWMEGGDRILALGQEYRRRYREKVCSGCSHEQKVRRDCASLSPNCDELECGHMTRAFARRHRRDIERHMASHPLAVRIRLNAGLASRRQ